MADEEYYFMQFAIDNILFIATTFVTIVGVLYGIRTGQPQVFQKIKIQVVPIGLFVIGLFWLIFFFIHRGDLGLQASELQRLVDDSEIKSDKVRDILIMNRTQSFRLDLLFFVLIFWGLVSYIMDAIDWLFQEEKNAELEE